MDIVFKTQGKTQSWSLSGDNIGTLTPPFTSTLKLGTLDNLDLPFYTNNNQRLTLKKDQGMFFSDGQGAEGANLNSAFILAPWAANSNPAVGGMRMDAMGNTEFHGTLRATKVNVDAVWWSDFVFAAEYKLIPLNQLESYIKTNQHLPNVPSEKEVLENGIDVANMQAIQQQKIEELTLYIIKMQKQMDAMQKQMVVLKQ